MESNNTQINLSQLAYQKPLKSNLGIIIAIVVTFLITGSGIFAWQQTIIKNSQEKNQKNIKELFDLTEYPHSISPAHNYLAALWHNGVSNYSYLQILDTNLNLMKEYSALSDDCSGSFSSNLRWSSDGKNLWAHFACSPIGGETIYFIKINADNWQAEKLPLPVMYNSNDSDQYDLNPDTGLLVYTDYKVDPQTDAIKDGKVYLFIYNFNTQEKKLITEAVNWTFNPRWATNNTIEYDNPRENKTGEFVKFYTID